MTPHTPPQNLPVLIIWNSAEGRVEAVDVEGHVTLVTHELLIWILLPSTDVTSTDPAGLVWVVLAGFTHGSTLSCGQTETTLSKCQDPLETVKGGTTKCVLELLIL